MTAGGHTDAVLLRALLELPQYRRWLNQPIDDGLKRRLDDADPQALMSIAAYALAQLTRLEQHDTPAPTV